MSNIKEQSKDLYNLVAGCIDDKLSFETMINCYFNNDGDTVLKGILNEAKNPEDMLHTLEQMNYVVKSDEKTNQFGDLQKKIVEQLGNERNLAFIETNIVNDAREIGEENTPNINAAKDVLDSMKQPTETLAYSKAA